MDDPSLLLVLVPLTGKGSAFMKFAARDWIFIAVIAIVLGVLLFSTLRKMPAKTPADAVHRPFLQALARGTSREDVERKCPGCHNPQAFPLPAKHPPKEQCLICHPGAA
jgi:hypothetical protein